jgi:DNA-binding response OmpR family regulator
MASRILLVEDDPTIGEVLATSLRNHAHDVVWEQTGAAGVAQAETGHVDLVLLDLGLPDLDGIEVCRQLRRVQPSSVLVMLSARTSEMDVVVGLEAGADDYLRKPFRLFELHARIRAHLRRNELRASAPPVRPVGDLVVDVSSRRVDVAGQDLCLRAKEFDLLARLAAEPGVALTRDTIMADVWDENWFGSTKTLDVHISALRKKLTEAAAATHAHVPRIVTLRGYGYRLTLDAPEVAAGPDR